VVAPDAGSVSFAPLSMAISTEEGSNVQLDQLLQAA
jgi:hypothetical protein